MLQKNLKILTAVLFLLTMQASAQIVSDSSKAIKPSTQVTFNAGYASNLHYFGRTDSLKSSAFVPAVTVKFTNGLYLSSSFIFVNNTNTKFAYTAAITEAGYKFGKETGIAGSVYADKFFYAANSGLVQSVQKGQVGTVLSHLNKIVNINSGASAVFSDKTDFFAFAGLDHLFRKDIGQFVLLANPTVTMNAGTQNFTSTYYKKRNVLFLPVAEEKVTESSRNFQVLSYEASLPITCIYKRFAVNISPSYVIPQNVIKVANRPDLSENAANLFYANVGISYTLGRL